MNPTWWPYWIICKLRNNKRNPVIVNLKKIDVNKEFKFYLHSDDSGLSKHLRVFGFREPLNYKFHCGFVKNSDVMLDIGANLGFFTILSSAAKKIFSIEPLDCALPILKKNVKEYGISKKVEFVNMAVGKKGKVYLEKNEQLNISKIVDVKNKNTIPVKSETLKFFVDKYKTNFIRMDLEGHEYEVLFKKIPSKVKKISLEFHTDILGRDKSTDLMTYFEKEGFVVKYLIEDLPLRLYPFHGFLKLTGLIKLFTFVKTDLRPLDSLKYIFKGRALKYLLLERK
ncbi:FkbM family methyltransferase [Candidatus Woesearchaeota archaeon]|jgi:FkbM family methyltransferase|nr:FkbM family methyltransferase [Candidatus Woesearchaeota archaeon]MBT6044735.1 FkbM family methyltransferase [Candidatus Woesearchaeota archaeon]